jgi:Flp pilus assembly protein TadD
MKGNRGAAREETRKGLEADPSNARLVGYSASLLELEGQWQEALRFRQRAAKLDPTAAGHAAGLATNLLWLRRYGDARRAADRYLILGPTNPEAYQLRAMVALGEGKLEEARRFIRNGATQIPSQELLPFVATYWDLYWLLDQDQQAQVLRMGPAQFYGDTVWWHTASAGIRLDQGDTAAARREAGVARNQLLRQLETSPEEAETHSRLALVNAYLGRGEEATREACSRLPRMLSTAPGWYIAWPVFSPGLACRARRWPRWGLCSRCRFMCRPPGSESILTFRRCDTIPNSGS